MTYDLIIEALLEYIPLYGSFSLLDAYDKAVQSGKISSAEKLLFETSHYDIKIASYLIDYGYAIRQRDDEYSNGRIHSFLHLTDEGRKLKGIGSLMAYHQDRKEAMERLNRQTINNEYLFWVVLLTGVGTCTSGLYDLLQMWEFYEKHVISFENIVYLLSGSILTIIVVLLSRLLKCYGIHLRRR